MMKRRRKSASWSRGLQALLAVSCLVVAGCAAEAMDEGVESSLADESGDLAPDDEGTAEDPVEEPAEDEATAGVAEEDTGEAEDTATGEEGSPTRAACAGFGQHCGGSTSCCAGLVCAFDGYVRYCRH